MNCPEVEKLLDDYVDGRLPMDLRRRVDAHVRQCQRCQLDESQLSHLLTAVGQLPQAIQPRRDLWPAISTRIVQPQADQKDPQAARWEPTPQVFPGSHWMALAAALLLLVVSASVMIHLLDGASTQAERNRTIGLVRSDVGSLAWQEFETAETEYRKITDELLRGLESRRSGLSEETVRIVEESLLSIDRAIGQARAALRTDPANGGLANKLGRIYRKKVDFLRQIHRLPA